MGTNRQTIQTDKLYNRHPTTIRKSNDFFFNLSVFQLIMAISGEFPHSIRVKIEFRGKTIRQRVKMTVDKRIMRFNGDNRTKVDLHKLKDDIHLYKKRGLSKSPYRIQFDYNNRTYTIKFKKQTQQKLFKAWIEENYVLPNYSGSSSATDSQSANNSPDEPPLRPQYILPIDMDIRMK